MFTTNGTGGPDPAFPNKFGSGFLMAQKKQGCGSGLNRVSKSGSRRAKMTHEIEKNLKKFGFVVNTKFKVFCK